MNAWHYYDHETPAQRREREQQEHASIARADLAMERRYGIREHNPTFEQWDQAGDLLNGDAERDEGRNIRTARPAVTTSLPKRGPGRETGIREERRTA